MMKKYFTLFYLFHFGEKGRDGKSSGRGRRRQCKFFYRCAIFYYFFSTRFSKLFNFFVQFLAFLITFEQFKQFSHISCVLIFQAPSCACVILYAFSISLCIPTNLWCRYWLSSSSKVCSYLAIICSGGRVLFCCNQERKLSDQSCPS